MQELKPILKNKRLMIITYNHDIDWILEPALDAGIEISLPSLGYLDITEKSLFGVPGALMLIEQIINGLRFLYV